MKLPVVLVTLSVAVMVVMIFQTLRQELTLRNLKTSITESSAEVKKKEASIVEVKVKIQELKKSLTALETKMEGVKKQKAEAETSDQQQAESLQACNSQREASRAKRSEMEEAINRLKGDHEVAKAQAQQDIQSLKQQILDRDKAICAFADTTKDEARRLCGLAPQAK